MFWWAAAFAWADYDRIESHEVGEFGEPGYEFWYTDGPGFLGWTGLVLRVLVIPTVVASARYVSRLTALQRDRRSV